MRETCLLPWNWRRIATIAATTTTTSISRSGVLERGAATVVCNVGTPKANGKVYVRVKANTSIANGVVGGFEAAADSTNTIEIPNMRWTSGAMDANRVCEVTLLTRASA